MSGIRTSQDFHAPLPLPQTAPVGPNFEFAPTSQSGPTVGNACPICWELEALATGVGGVGWPSLPPVPSPKVRLTQEDSCEEALAAGQPWRSLAHGACKCEALSCWQGDLKAPRMEASGDADGGGTEAPRGSQGWRERAGSCRQSAWAQTSAPGVSPVSAFLF